MAQFQDNIRILYTFCNIKSEGYSKISDLNFLKRILADFCQILNSCNRKELYILGWRKSAHQEICPPGNLPTGNFPTGNLPTGKYAYREICPPEMCPSENCPLGNLPTGIINKPDSWKMSVGKFPGGQFSSDPYHNEINYLYSLFKFDHMIRKPRFCHCFFAR